MKILSPNSPIVRMSFILAMMASGTMALSNLLMPGFENVTAIAQTRQAAAKIIAIQASQAVQSRSTDALEHAFTTLVEHDNSILSIAIWQSNGSIVASSGNHLFHQDTEADTYVPENHVRIPMYNENNKWGDLEVVFDPEVIGFEADKRSESLSFLWTVCFMVLGGFASNLFFLRNALSDLDPSAVVPQRVRSALDVLAEGLVVIDEHEHILLANAAFCRKIKRSSNYLVGLPLSSLDWSSDEVCNVSAHLPWFPVLAGETTECGAQVNLVLPTKDSYTFAVHVVPVAGSENTIRGAIVTFDDLTHVEEANGELRRTLGRLEEIQEDMAQKNKELFVLATRDSLSNTLNRRALFEAFEDIYKEATTSNIELSCIMVDIDKFKSINDRFGHGVGDQVIKKVAHILNSNSRATDIVGRYGGEEFCVLLPETSLGEALKIGEMLRGLVETDAGSSFDPPMLITASFGVSSTHYCAVDPLDLCNQSDRSLYVAKESGRNKVIGWPEVVEYERIESTSVSLTEESTDSKDSTGTTDNTASTQNTASTNSTQNTASTDSTQNTASKDSTKSTESTESTKSTVNAESTKSSDSTDSSGDKSADSRLLEMSAKINRLENDLQKSERVRAELECRSNGFALKDTSILHDRLAQSLIRSQRTKTKVAVMVIEFAAYRDVNAAFGIAYSERLIESVGQRLNSNLRDTDTVSLIKKNDSDLILARASDDTFVLILVDLLDDDALVRIVARIEKSISRVFEIDGREFHVSPRFGIALGPADGGDAITLMASANAALDHARKSGEDDVVYRFYASDMNNFARDLLSLEADLYRAVERQEFVLHYQPRVNCATGTINGFEALLRWAHPTRGLVMPDSFITLAEKTGLIEQIGEWVIETACRQLADWSSLGNPHLEIAINVSPIQMKSTKILDVLKTQASAARLDPHRIEIELTESVILGDIEKVVPLMRSIEATGFKIALDDFGTGYSSLGYLNKLPLHRLKIDRSFLSELGDSVADYTIVSAIIEMAHALEMNVVVEGVEEVGQWAVLQELGCDELQGYLLSRPVASGAATELLSQGALPQLKLLQKKHKNHSGVQRKVAIRGVLNDASNESTHVVENFKRIG